MLFNSFVFLVFFVIVYSVYWGILNKTVRGQNIFLSICSFIFYGWWNWKFLLLLWLSLFVDFFVGKFLGSTLNEKKRKGLIIFSLVFNIGLLGFFKYFNFFIHSAGLVLLKIGLTPHLTTLNVILPVGISFYTFQSLSYTIDIYKKEIKPTKHLIDYVAFVSFFPQLVAGPIERAKHMLPQFTTQRKFNYEQSVKGLQLILWGFFKKVVIADLCAPFVSVAFNGYSDKIGMALLVPAIYFAFQIYGDFSGYTDIARGLAKLLGFDLMLNFRYPYFSRDIAEFWRRWHISLSSWFRDYLYLPLGGSRVGKLITVRNTFVVFLVSGFWHGANFTFIVWGLLHALFFLPLLLTNQTKKNISVVAQGKVLPSLKEVAQILFTFLLVVFAWIFFRADNLTQAFGYIRNIFKAGPIYFLGATTVFPLIVFMILVEWIGRHEENALNSFVTKLIWLKYPIYIFLFVWVYANFSKENTFIYFQF
jgi:D-alanyl-lipoteichoic acid acyltransferase DltB (MBOAT superfamily)